MPESPSPPGIPPRELQIRAARAAIVKELGADQLASLHEGRLALDLVAIFGSIALFLACAWVLGTWSVRDALWWLCLLVQGDLILVMAFINHDVFAHRKLLPPKLRWVMSSILVWPSQLRSSVYERLHMKHHRALGTDADSEAYKQDIDTALKRILYAAPTAAIYRFVFLSKRTASMGVGAQEPGSADPVRVRYERATQLALFGAAIAIAAWDWRLVVYGYLLPLAVVTPFFNTVRIVLEHFDLDRANPFATGTYYRSGPATRLLFWWGAGDCHVVHHFYANIPFYRVGRAVELMRPILLRSGVYEQRSLPRLLGEWFTGSRGHWTAPPKASSP